MPVLSPEERVARLEARLATVTEEIREKKARLNEVEKLAKKEVQLRLRRARYAVSAKERKIRTRRFILIGSAVHAETRDDPAAQARLLKLLDGHLTKPHDRALFGLAPLPEDAG